MSKLPTENETEEVLTTTETLPEPPSPDAPTPDDDAAVEETPAGDVEAAVEEPPAAPAALEKAAIEEPAPAAPAGDAVERALTVRTKWEAGNALFQENKPKQALAVFKEIDLADASPELKMRILNNMGAILMETNEESEARIAFAEALELGLRSEMIDTVHNLAMAEKALGMYEEALVNFQYCIDAQKGFYSALCGKGEALNALKKYEEGIAASLEAIAIQPESYRAHANKVSLNI
jgi:tetratricopeptide (TPR) repeat protein